MITVKNKVVSFTGKDAKQLDDLSKSLGLTPQQIIEKALTEHMNRLDKPTKKTTKRSPK